MRFSSYSILSNPISDRRRVLMNGISGALASIDEELAGAIEESLRTRDAAPAIALMTPETRTQFAEAGHLTEFTVDEERDIVRILAHDAHSQMLARPSFMIVPNLDCNYRCTYCFERPLQNTLKSADAHVSHTKNNVVMQPDQAAPIFDAIRILRAEQGLAEQGQVILYGGEPLDRRNADAVRAIVDEGLSRGVFFAAITNGHDLDAYVDLLGSGKIEQVQISIDGPKRVHDKRRVYVGRDSSFDRLVENIHLILAETDVEVQIRSHVDPANIALFGELIDFFEGQGWLDHPQVVIYGNTVYDRHADGGVGARLDVSDIDDALSPNAQRASNIFTSAPEVHARRSILPALSDDHRVALKGTYCSANTGNYIFAPDGCVYACWESVGKACSRIGTYDGNGVTLDAKAVAKWFGRSIATLPTCQECAYALVCGGGCAQYAEYEHGTLYASYCDDFQRTFRSALARTVDRFVEGSESEGGPADDRRIKEPA